MDCIFCKIASNEIPGTILYQDKEIIAFRDINPVAPTHIVIIPKKHIPTLADLSEDESALIGHMAEVANHLAREEDISDRGYRIVVNCGREGGQLIDHLHMHLIGGRQLTNEIG